MLAVSLGVAGEIVAQKFLIASRFEIVEQNYKCPIGEIDLVATRAGVLYFIEVKTRTSTKYGWPAEAVTPKKQRKLRQLALYYLAKHPSAVPVNFGVVEVLYDRYQIKYQVNFIPNAF